MADANPVDQSLCNDMNRLNLREAMSAARSRSLEAGKTHPLSPAAIDAASLLPAWGFVGLGVVCACAMVWAGIVGAHDCRVRPIPLALGVDTTVSIALPANTPCTILVSADSTSLEDIAIETPPGHGTLTPRGRSGVIYRPAPRFKGDESFAFSIRGRSGAASRISVIRVRASVK